MTSMDRRGRRNKIQARSRSTFMLLLTSLMRKQNITDDGIVNYFCRYDTIATISSSPCETYRNQPY